MDSSEQKGNTQATPEKPRRELQPLVSESKTGGFLMGWDRHAALWPAENGSDSQNGAGRL